LADFKTTEREFLAAVLASDINTYSVSRAFYEEFGVRSYVFGKVQTGPSYQSKFITFESNPHIDEDEYFIERMTRFGKEHSDKKIFIMGCGDDYVAMISRCKDRLPENFIAPFIDFELMDKLQHKDYFYGLCEKYGIAYPETIIHTKDMGLDFQCDFSYPVIVKASNSPEYWAHPFPGQDKVFKLDTREEVNNVVTKMRDAGYESSIIIQDTIPGNDEFMRVLTCYSNKEGKVEMMCLGHVLLEEHTPHGLGNHSCIIPEYNKEVMDSARRMLEDLHYVGFSNFDIKYDTRDGSYRFFEINTRQGRSNFYVTAAGFNIARYLVGDYIYDKLPEHKEFPDEKLWLTVPKGVAKKYVHDPKNREDLDRLISSGNYVNPVFFKGDNRPGRILRMLRNHFRQFKNYKTYYK